MKDEPSRRPHYGYYALPIVTVLSAIILALGVLAAELLSWLAGVVLIGFGVYNILSYGVSMYLTWDQTKASELPRMVHVRGDEKALDVGCGLGKMTIGVAKVLKKGRVVGIDIWDKMRIMENSAERAYENARIEGVQDRVEFRYGDVLDIPFPDEYFDLATAQSVLFNLPQRRHPDMSKSKALSEIYRVLRPRGKVVIVEPLRNLRSFFTIGPFGFWGLLSKDGWMTILKEAGFINIEYAYDNGLGIFASERPVRE